MDDAIKKKLQADADGLATYEYIANHIDTCRDDIDMLVDNMDRVDRTGQFVISAARYLYAIDSESFAAAIDRLINLGIEKDPHGAVLRRRLHRSRRRAFGIRQ